MADPVDPKHVTELLEEDTEEEMHFQEQQIHQQSLSLSPGK